MTSKEQALSELRGRVLDMLKASSEGAPFPQLARAQGLVDGYMSAMLTTGVATQRELLDLMASARADAHGAATRTLERAVA